MRPVRLVMQAFGSYAGQQILEMDELGEMGLYAITGETGAGKTTIFDAIVYALYEDASGEDRNINNLRSTAADPNTETYVELDFVSGGKAYHIKRSPKQVLAGKNKTAKVVLTMPDGTPYTNTKEVQKRIVEDILGVTKDQFCQIVMIAQGEFRKLLKANTQERTVILRRIFRTERYDTLASEMNRLCGEKAEELKSNRNQILFSLKALRGESGTELYEALEQMKQLESRALILEDAEKLAEEIAQADLADYGSAKEDLEKAAKEKEDARIALDKGSAQIRNQNELSRLNALQASRKEEWEKARKEQESAEEKRSDIDRLRQEITLEENALPKYDTLESLEQEHGSKQEEIRKQKETKEHTEDEVNRLKQKNTALDQEAEKIQDAGDRLLEATKALSEATGKQDKLNQLEARVKELETVQEDLDNKNAAVEKAKTKEAQTGSRLETLSRELEKLGNTELKLLKLNEEEEKLKAEEEQLLKLAQFLSEYREKKDQLEKAEKGRAEKEQVYTKLQAEAEKLRLQYNTDANIIRILASELKEGEPCPVCGSIHHPQKAVQSVTVAKAEVDAAEAAAEQAKKDFDEQADICRELERDRHNLEEKITEQLPELKENTWESELKKRQADAAGRKAETTEELKNATAADERRIQLEKTEIPDAKKAAAEQEQQARELEKGQTAAKTALTSAREEVAKAAEGLMPEGWTKPDLENAISENAKKEQEWREKEQQASLDKARLLSITEEKKTIADQLKQKDEIIRNAEKQIERLSADLGGIEKQLSSLKKDLPHDSKKACEASISQKSEQKKAMEENIAAAEKKVHDLEKAIAETAGQIKGIEEELKDQPPVDMDALQKDYDEKNKAHETAGEREKTVLARKRNNEDNIKSLKDTAAQVRALEQEYRLMRDVADVAAGNVNGQERITLETYVQTSYFDQIIRYANRRLIHMSRQQYEFVRQDAKEKDKRSQTGLELDVVDHANGTRRDVSTLSGGESFLAALSFALGMSDAIQASAASAVQLDSMFVDEGFGSLSERFLELVMDELNDTAASGHRLIGIISHVDDVQEGIERRIEVTKDENGSSKAEIIC